MVFRSAAVNARNACCTLRPSWLRIDAGTSCGFCVMKNMPTPLERMSLITVSICCSNASVASWKTRCASSINMTSLGLSISPSSGRFAYSSASRLNINVENSFGLLCISVTLSTLTLPLPSSAMRIRSSTSNEGSPKKRSAPCCCNSMTLRRMVPVDEVEIFPYCASISFLPSLLTY